MFTVRDVQRGTNAGLGVFSVTMAGLGLLFGGMAVFAFVALRNMPDPPPPLAPPEPDASPMARSLYATDQVQELLDQAYPLPGYTWYRVDRGKLAASVEEMRRSGPGIGSSPSTASHRSGLGMRVSEASSRIARRVLTMSGRLTTISASARW